MAIDAGTASGNPTALYGFQFDVKFDPTVLQVVQVAEGQSFFKTNLSDFQPGKVDNTNGTISTSYDTLQGSFLDIPDQPAEIAVVLFKAIKPGTGNVTLQHPVIVDASGHRMILNAGQPSYSLSVVDTTPPVVIPTVTGTLGANGWYTSPVKVTWQEADQYSTITSQACPPTTISADTAGQTVSCTATDGAGLKTTQTVTIKKDASLPSITPVVTGTQGANGWYTSNVTVAWKETGGVSGITSAQCAQSSVNTDTAGTTFSCLAASGAGLQTTKSVTIKRDATPPVISGLPAQGTCYLWPPNGRLVTVATVTAKAGVSGLASGSPQVTATSTPSNGQSSDIVINNGVVQLRATVSHGSLPRVYTITATASDSAGEKSTATTQCTVARPPD
jgi:hypothetical protein